MATLKCSCGFAGQVPDGDIGKEFICTECGRKLVALEDKSMFEVQHPVSEKSQQRTGSYEQKEQEAKFKFVFDGGVGPVGFGYQEIKEARKKIFIGTALLLIFGLITLALLSNRYSMCFAVLTVPLAAYGAGLLIWGLYEEYIHEHGIPKK